MSAFNTYSLLTVHLDAIASNYRYLRGLVSPSICASVLKADSYGLGIEAIAPLLYNEGCRHFFVAYTNEAVALKSALSSVERNSHIYVLNGPYLKGWQSYYHHNQFIPVLNDLEAVQEWQSYGKEIVEKMATVLHFDTGMKRLAIQFEDFSKLLQSKPDHLDIRLIMSHLSCADEKTNPANLEQLSEVNSIKKQHPNLPISLASSGGIFLNPDYYFDMVRPGMALYGYNSVPEDANKLMPCVELEAMILQIQDVKTNEYVGYNRTFQTKSPSKLATLAIGYADGVPWAICNQGGYVLIKDKKAPIVGRGSMDLISVDITDIPNVSVGDWANLLGNEITLDHWAKAAKSSNYELLLKLGKRLRKIYATQKQQRGLESVSC
ncbi:MAG: alanine racemase [Alphaproteobacteria bacterium]|nr:alanine racemase [Alphaproteobacteria bacterium]